MVLLSIACNDYKDNVFHQQYSGLCFFHEVNVTNVHVAA